MCNSRRNAHARRQFILLAFRERRGDQNGEETCFTFTTIARAPAARNTTTTNTTLLSPTPLSPLPPSLWKCQSNDGVFWGACALILIHEILIHAFATRNEPNNAHRDAVNANERIYIIKLCHYEHRSWLPPIQANKRHICICCVCVCVCVWVCVWYLWHLEMGLLVV